ncbi:DUF5082 domain-containing protein [Lacticaseibacillus zeae]|uniref:DUF5082 domain-containing protein n=1 Tax=Lacticaseibacillus zeae TaxID=57037 RepID=A0A5R8LX66_LACZE|nr:DUF5082 family protein [Lacticaseibacillus zeae]TLF41870.1 DUF5082 domain-containing protein [Lacticaseibacillus zeae]
MSDDAAKAARRQNLRGRISDYDDQMTSIQSKIARLKEAETKLQAAKTELTTHQSTLRSISGLVNNGQWRGKRQNEFSKDMDQMTSQLKSDQEKIDNNLDLVRAKINSLSSDVSQMSSSISGLRAELASI